MKSTSEWGCSFVKRHKAASGEDLNPVPTVQLHIKVKFEQKFRKKNFNEEKFVQG